MGTRGIFMGIVWELDKNSTPHLFKTKKASLGGMLVPPN
jgi:hypothetical protein